MTQFACIATVLLFAFNSAAKSVHAVFDIDETIAIHVEYMDQWPVNERPQGHVKTVYVQDDSTDYFIFPGVVEGIEELLQEGVKVSFFSAGNESRNLELLKAIKLEDGKSLLDISHKVLSRHHQEPGLQPKKNVALVDASVEDVILVDNSSAGVIETQVDNWIPVRGVGIQSFQDGYQKLRQVLQLAKRTGLSLTAARRLLGESNQSVRGCKALLQQ